MRPRWLEGSGHRNRPVFRTRIRLIRRFRSVYVGSSDVPSFRARGFHRLLLPRHGELPHAPETNLSLVGNRTLDSRAVDRGSRGIFPLDRVDARPIPVDESVQAVDVE